MSTNNAYGKRKALEFTDTTKLERTGMRMTQAEVSAYEARRMADTGRRIKQGVSECLVESELHNQILQECRRRGWIALHGSMASPTRRTEGEEDFIIRADGGRVFWIECKTKAGKLSPAQQAMHAHARKLGHVSHVVRSLQEFLALL